MKLKATYSFSLFNFEYFYKKSKHVRLQLVLWTSTQFQPDRVSTPKKIFWVAT
jgi:hypothetical protein